MQNEITSLLEERLTMLGALAHDLRSYLTRLRLRAEFIENETARTKTVADISAMSALTEAALEFARIGTQSVDLKRMPIAPLVRDLAHRNDVTCAGCDDDTILADIDIVLFERIMRNLSSNAAKYAGGGRLALTVGREVVTVTVSDDGPSFPAEVMQRVDQPFRRGDVARSLDVPGTGLGLAIASRSARKMGGELRLSNDAVGGASACLVLPNRRPTPHMGRI